MAMTLKKTGIVFGLLVSLGYATTALASGTFNHEAAKKGFKASKSQNFPVACAGCHERGSVQFKDKELLKKGGSKW